MSATVMLSYYRDANEALRREIGHLPRLTAHQEVIQHGVIEPASRRTGTASEQQSRTAWTAVLAHAGQGRLAVTDAAAPVQVAPRLAGDAARHAEVFPAQPSPQLLI